MIFTNKVDKIDIDEVFGKAKADIKAINSKSLNIVSDNISMIGSAVDEYIASRYDEITNLNYGESIRMDIDLVTHAISPSTIKPINDFKFLKKVEVTGHSLKFSVGRCIAFDIPLKDLIGKNPTLKDERQLEKRLETYFSDISNIFGIGIFRDEIHINLGWLKANKKFESDIYKFLKVYFDKRKIKADVRGDEIQIYGFIKEE